MVCSSCQCATHACNSRKCPHVGEYNKTCDMAGTKAEKLAARMQLIHAKLAADAKIVADDDAEERFELQVEMLEADCAEKIEAKELEVANRIDAYVRAKEIELLGKLNAELAARRTELEFCFDASVNNACYLINNNCFYFTILKIACITFHIPRKLFIFFYFDSFGYVFTFLTGLYILYI